MSVEKSEPSQEAHLSHESQISGVNTNGGSHENKDRSKRSIGRALGYFKVGGESWLSLVAAATGLLVALFAFLSTDTDRIKISRYQEEVFKQTLDIQQNSMTSLAKNLRDLQNSLSSTAKCPSEIILSNDSKIVRSGAA